MTEFKQLELMYNHLSALTSQIKELINEEDYESAELKIKEKDKLIKKIFLARKTINFTDDEKNKIELIDKQISEDNHKFIEDLTQIHREIASELNKVNKKVRVNSAYEIRTTDEAGNLIDTIE